MKYFINDWIEHEVGQVKDICGGQQVSDNVFIEPANLKFLKPSDQQTAIIPHNIPNFTKLFENFNIFPIILSIY